MILNWELVVLGLGIGDLNPTNTEPQFKITNWSFDHQLVISTISFLIQKVYIMDLDTTEIYLPHQREASTE